MPALLLTILKATGSAVFAMLTKLATEKFLSAILLKLLGYLVKKSTNTLDDDLYEEVKKNLNQ